MTVVREDVKQRKTTIYFQKLQGRVKVKQFYCQQGIFGLDSRKYALTTGQVKPTSCLNGNLPHWEIFRSRLVQVSVKNHLKVLDLYTMKIQWVKLLFIPVYTCFCSFVTKSSSRSELFFFLRKPGPKGRYSQLRGWQHCHIACSGKQLKCIDLSKNRR